MKTSVLLVALLVSSEIETLGQIPRTNQWQQQQAPQQSAPNAAAKNADWETFRNDAVARLANEKSNALATLSEEYSPALKDLQPQAAALEQKARDIEANNTVWVTNSVKAGPNHRVVNGKVYDITYSELWGKFASLAGLGQQPDALHFHNLRNFAVVQKKIGTTVFYDISQSDSYPEKYSGRLEEIGRKYLETVVILNYPNPESLITGGSVACLCMMTTNFHSSDGLSYKTYDCGVQATGFVTEVVRSRPDAATVKKIEDVKNRLSPIKLMLSQIQSELDKAKKKIGLEYEMKIKDLPNIFAKQLKEKEDENRRAITAKTVAWNQAQADRGDAFGLLRMGERYRDGDGVDKDLAKARAYLTRAAAAGSPTAEAELKALP